MKFRANFMHSDLWAAGLKKRTGTHDETDLCYSFDAPWMLGRRTGFGGGDDFIGLCKSGECRRLCPHGHSIDDAPIMQVARDLPQVDSGNSSHALVWQEGDFNTSSIEQSGGRNVGAAIQQSGSGHQPMIFQQGRNNTAILSQR